MSARGSALRLIAERTYTHYQGLACASRALRRNVGPRIARRLLRLYIAAAVVRNIMRASVVDFLGDLDSALSFKAYGDFGVANTVDTMSEQSSGRADVLTYSSEAEKVSESDSEFESIKDEIITTFINAVSVDGDKPAPMQYARGDRASALDAYYIGEDTEDVSRQLVA